MATTSQIRNDIEYVVFAEHEYPMERYTELRGIIDDLVKLVETHCTSAVEAAVREVKYDVAKSLQESVYQTVQNCVSKHSQLEEPFETPPKSDHALDELLMIDI